MQMGVHTVRAAATKNVEAPNQKRTEENPAESCEIQQHPPLPKCRKPKQAITDQPRRSCPEDSNA